MIDFGKMLKEAYEEVERRNKEFEQRKLEILIEVVKSGGASESLIERFKKDGLPKYIYVGDKFNEELCNNFSFFCPVRPHSLIENNGTMIFSWVEEGVGHTKLGEPIDMNFKINQL